MFQRALWLVAGAANCDPACLHSHICAQFHICKVGRTRAGCGTLGKYPAESAAVCLEFYNSTARRLSNHLLTLSTFQWPKIDMSVCDLQLWPNKGLSCGSSSVFSGGSHLFPRSEDQGRIFTSRPKARRAPPLWRSTKNVSIPRANYWFAVWGGIRCPLCRHKTRSLWLALSRRHSQS